MNKPLLMLTYSPIEQINYDYTKYTFEKIITRSHCFKYETLRKYKVRHTIKIDYQNKTICINGIIFNTCYVSGYTYKKMKGKMIGCSSFISLVEHIKESANKGSVFHHSTFEVLSTFSKKQYSILN